MGWDTNYGQSHAACSHLQALASFPVGFMDLPRSMQIAVSTEVGVLHTGHLYVTETDNVSGHYVLVLHWPLYSIIVL